MSELMFSPIEVGGVCLRNRVVVPGHTTNFAEHNLPTRRHAAYLGERARGGAGLIITEAIRVHPTSAGRHLSLGSFDDASVPAYAQLVEAVHEHGAAFFAQIMHAGRQANGEATRTAAWSASALPWSPSADIPHAMGHTDIDTVVAGFGAAARRMAAAGFDGVEVHAGHGHLLQQFLSPATNLRDDEYGGDADRRLRLTREVLTRVRAAAPGLPIGLRVSADEFLDGGLRPDDVIEIVGRLSGEFALAYVHVSHSAYQASYSLSTQMADMSFGHAPFREHAAMFKKALPHLPVVAVCRLDSLAEAAELLDAGEADLVALARPHIADPHLVRKAREGLPARGCLACNQGCIARVEKSLPITCVVNPEVGVEDQWNDAWQALSSPRRRRVIVVGGGPAGLQAALSAARAGDRVTLVERAETLGGQLATAAAMSHRARLGLLIRDLERDLRSHDVEIRVGTEVDTVSILAGGWDDVIVATGSVPRRHDFGAGVPVLTSVEAAEQVAARKDVAGLRFALWDDDGDWTSASIAEGLALLGADVHIVTPTPSLHARITTYSRLALTPRLRELRVHAHLMRTLAVSGRGRVVLTDTLSGDSDSLTDVFAVVDLGRPRARDELYRELERMPDGPRVHVVGDANSPRTALEAVFEGRIAGAFLGDAETSAARAVVAGH
ncbi:FAD-dependent oxidoreductase [Nocardioides carbamazepini]|uniref:oxidoreductase n=1 Tax=Nocardioides carbamazepini TaxID=2854259 RepID=UPI00214A80CE|nr:FAD-dependent oxidoreductase [Nocardioides carbamazepini]MCR1783740.1 FAD-dependent oxidoreductase [Nocardioides carbamazepini]